MKESTVELLGEDVECDGIDFKGGLSHGYWKQWENLQ